MVDKTAGLAAGVAIGYTADAVWKAWPGHVYLTEERSPLASFDHIHWGIAALIAERKTNLGGLGYGVGASLIALEFAYPDHFIGRDPAEAAASNALTALLALFLVFS